MTDNLRELRARVRTFIDGEVIPAEPVLDAGGPEAAAAMNGLMASAKKQGLWALGHPAELGGGGLSLYDFALVNEVIGRSEYGQRALGTLSMQDSIMLDRYLASAEQRTRWLLPLVAGEIRPSVAMTEPEVAGSDPTRIRTTAVLEGGEWVINGHKWFTTGAHHAGFTTVFAVTDPEADPHRSISAILVPAGTPGLEIVRAVRTMGSDHGDHCEIRLTDVRVPEQNLLGVRGEGFAVAQRRLGPGRIFHAMRWLGQAQRAFDLMCARAKSREAHGSLLSEKGEIRRYIAESAAEIQAARLLTLDAARRYDLDGRAKLEISMVKFWGARMLHNVIDRAIQVHGALGVTEDTPLERMYRSARYARIYDGPDEVHRMVVARQLLKGNAPWDELPA
ncbi:acyl-CoA dehydrogenase family protein [Streptomyces sp. BE230]|uniref:acyl-CoA dehydrogenase family protein n=1 Tax=Streptomyces sp. BE230 TaxID=3002526 RepID=UPI002ED0DDDD|nr:acyl-CoA dehydrogenase family protein [Streptomyces sp. BE230]